MSAKLRKRLLAQWGRESRTSIRLFLDNCPADCLRICDINLRQKYYTKATIRESLRRADILKLNEDELDVITRLFGFKMAGEEVLWKGGHSFQGTPKVKVVSAVGAGDSFTGSFIGAYLSGASIPQAHVLAVQVSAHVCTQKGAMPVIPADLLH